MKDAMRHPTVPLPAVLRPTFVILRDYTLSPEGQKGHVFLCNILATLVRNDKLSLYEGIAGQRFVQDCIEGYNTFEAWCRIHWTPEAYAVIQKAEYISDLRRAPRLEWLDFLLDTPEITPESDTE